MTIPVNRCKQYLAKSILYQPHSYSELEKKLNRLADRSTYVVVVYNPANQPQAVVQAGGNLDRAICEKVHTPPYESYSNEIKLVFKDKRKALILTDGNPVSLHSAGTIRWIGPLEQYNKLMVQGYFRRLFHSED